MKTKKAYLGKPFLRWAGGKNWLLKHLESILPKTFNNYHEPFLGGGSVFIHLKSVRKINKKAFLCDKNQDLINAYNVLKNKPNKLISVLREFQNEKDFYYFMRNQSFSDRTQLAAQFIFLNRTSFNGIYRVNLKGEYNVPYGFKKYNQLFDFENLIRISKLLNNTVLNSGDFSTTLNDLNKGDLVFLDPPYTVAHENNGFVKYNQKIFLWEDQVRLKEYIEKVKAKDAYFIMTNAAHKSINGLFHDIGNLHKFYRHSVVGGKGAERRRISEYIYTNV